jgi:hypothetical protein
MGAIFKLVEKGGSAVKKNWSKYDKWLAKVAGAAGVPIALAINTANGPEAILNKYGQLGVQALQTATPIDTGETAASWSYQVKKANGGYSLEFYNSHTNQGVNIAVILQYGHGTGIGTYVEGIDYINPALKPIFDQISEQVWEGVTSA